MLLKLNTLLLKIFKDSKVEKLIDTDAPISKKQWIEADRLVLIILALIVVAFSIIFS